MGVVGQPVRANPTVKPRIRSVNRRVQNQPGFVNRGPCDNVGFLEKAFEATPRLAVTEDLVE